MSTDINSETKVAEVPEMPDASAYTETSGDGELNQQVQQVLDKVIRTYT